MQPLHSIPPKGLILTALLANTHSQELKRTSEPYIYIEFFIILASKKDTKHPNRTSRVIGVVYKPFLYFFSLCFSCSKFIRRVGTSFICAAVSSWLHVVENLPQLLRWRQT